MQNQSPTHEDIDVDDDELPPAAKLPKDDPNRYPCNIPLDAIPTGRDTIHAALVSGGMDSTVGATIAWEHAPKLDYLVYLDTRTGLDENRRYLHQLADTLEIQLWTLRTHQKYEDLVTENGFPGPSRHFIYYQRLKDRQLGKLATTVGNDKELVFWSGMRSLESERRMKNVDPIEEDDRWWWVAPIHDWTKQQCRDYIDIRGLPRNPIWDTLGRSGDCFCGCFGSPEEKLDLRACGADYHADWIEQLEADVSDEDVPDNRDMWAWGALSEDEIRRYREMDDRDVTNKLCSNCEFNPDVAADPDDPDD